MSFNNSATNLRNRLDDVTTRLSYINSKVVLKEMQMAKAVSQIDLLTNKIKGVRVRLQRAEEQNNVIFINHLEMELTTLENVRCAFHRFISSRRRDVVELEHQMNDLDNEMAMLTEKMEDDDLDSDDSESDEFESDEFESDEFESDEFECDEFESVKFKCDDSGSDRIVDRSKKRNKLNPEFQVMTL